MKNQRIFPGIILIGVGIYFFLQHAGISISPQFYSWPTLLIIVGIAFLGQGYIGKDYEAILPGVILVGFGLHFHVLSRFPLLANHIGTFILILALGLFLRYQKTNSGLFQAMLFLILSVFLLFYDNISDYFGYLQDNASTIWKFWPLFLIGIGIFFVFRSKK